jgi:RNA polymerase sigma factor (sigma-70 family)
LGSFPERTVWETVPTHYRLIPRLNLEQMSTKPPNPKKSKTPKKSAPHPPDIEEIILKFWPQIRYRVINSLGYHNPDWEDTASEILLSVFEALKNERFREESSIGTFIYSITSNKIVDTIRKKGKAMPTVKEPERFLDPHDRIQQKERAIYVAELIKTLKPRHADMLYLHYYIDLTQIQIARIFGISPRRVHAILDNARRSLKKLVISS